jgi:hypothetical protein
LVSKKGIPKGEVVSFPIISELKNYLSEQKIAPLATGITMRSKKKTKVGRSIFTKIHGN